MPKRRGDTPHLWVLLTDRDASGLAVCVNITTQQTYSETTVVLVPGDHEFIQHQSVAFYTDARELNINSAESLIGQKQSMFPCEAHKPCSETLLARLREGLLASANVSPKLKVRCAKEWGIEYPSQK